jgi:hypothetical protein
MSPDEADDDAVADDEDDDDAGDAVLSDADDEPDAAESAGAPDALFESSPDLEPDDSSLAGGVFPPQARGRHSARTRPAARGTLRMAPAIYHQARARAWMNE